MFSSESIPGPIIWVFFISLMLRDPITYAPPSKYTVNGAEDTYPLTAKLENPMPWNVSDTGSPDGSVPVRVTDWCGPGIDER